MNNEPEKIIELGYKLSAETTFSAETCIFTLGRVLAKSNYLTLEELREKALEELYTKTIYQI